MSIAFRGVYGNAPRAQPTEIIYQSDQLILFNIGDASALETGGGCTHADNGNETHVGFLDLERERDEEDSDRVESLYDTASATFPTCSRSPRWGCGRGVEETYLEHLDEADAEGQVGVVGQDERAREQGADRQDRPDPSVSLSSVISHVVYNSSDSLQRSTPAGELKITRSMDQKTHAHLNVLGTVHERRRALQYAGSNGLLVPSQLMLRLPV